MSKFHIHKNKVLYNTHCGRLSKHTVLTLNRLKSYPISEQCKKCKKIIEKEAA